MTDSKIWAEVLFAPNSYSSRILLSVDNFCSRANKIRVLSIMNTTE